MFLFLPVRLIDGSVPVLLTALQKYGGGGGGGKLGREVFA